MPAEQSLSIQQVADRAGVDEEYVRTLEELGVLSRDERYGERNVHLVALLHLWEEAGLSRTAILEAAEAGELSLDFLESPGWELPAPLERTYRQLAEERVCRSSCSERSTSRSGSPRPTRTSGPDRTTPRWRS